DSLSSSTNIFGSIKYRSVESTMCVNIFALRSTMCVDFWVYDVYRFINKQLKNRQFNQIIDEFVTATNIIVVVEGPEEQIKIFADELAPLLLSARDDSLNAKYEKK
ncbi:MAG: hypothetical protein ABIK95_03495, partial [Acidobacteriota bacterium]